MPVLSQSAYQVQKIYHQPVLWYTGLSWNHLNNSNCALLILMDQNIVVRHPVEKELKDVCQLKQNMEAKVGGSEGSF